MLLDCFVTLISLFLESTGKIIPKIVNGQACEPGQFPSIVSLEYVVLNAHFCGGTILDKTHVVTAAHCFQLIPILPVHAVLVRIVAGDLQLGKNASPSRQVITLKKIKIHPHFNPLNLKNDLAILSLSRPLSFTEFVKPIKLAVLSPNIGTQCSIAGWGLTKEKGSFSSSLLFTEVTVYDGAPCAVENVLPDEKQICAGDITGQNDSCQGDSGGPLYCGNQLSGIVSYGEGCARENKAGVYLDVSKHRAWITKLMKKTDESDLLTQAFHFTRFPEFRPSPFSFRLNLLISMSTTNFLIDNGHWLVSDKLDAVVVKISGEEFGILLWKSGTQTQIGD